MRVFFLAEEGGMGAGSAAAVLRFATSSPLALGGAAGFEVAGAALGDTVHVVKLVASGSAYDALGAFTDKAAADALARARKDDGARVASLPVE
jgi:hypothetical protein